MRTRTEIIEGHYTCTCAKIYTSRNMVDPSCVLHEHGGEIELIMEEFAKEEAQSYFLWNIKRMFPEIEIQCDNDKFNELWNLYQQQKSSLK